MADKFKNTRYKAGFGPLHKPPRRKSLGENVTQMAEKEWIAREKAKDKPNYSNIEKLLERQRRERAIKFAKEHPLMPRTKPKRVKKRPIKKVGGLSRKPATKFDVDVRSPFANQAFLRKVSGR